MEIFIVNKQKVIFICLLSLFINCFAIAPKRANAVALEVAISAEAITALACASLVAYDIVASPSISKEKCSALDDTISSYVSNRWQQVNDVKNKVSVKVSSTGQKFLTWTKSGFEWFQQTIEDFFAKDTIAITGDVIRFSACPGTIPLGQFPSNILFCYSDNTTGGWSGAVRKTETPVTARVESISNSKGNIYSKVLFEGETWDDGSSSSCYKPGASISIRIENYTEKVSDVINPNRTYDYGSNPDVLPCPQDISIPLDSVVSSNSISYNPSRDWFSDLPSVPWENVNENYKTPTKELPYDRDFVGDDTNIVEGEGEVEGDTTGSIRDGILNIPILGAILKALLAILELLKGLVSSLIDALISALQALLTALFVPSDTFFSDKFGNIKDILISKLGYQQYIDAFKGFNEGHLQDITINWYGKTLVIVKMTTFEKFRELFNGLCYGFMFFGLAVYNYSQIYRLIRGNSYAKMSQTISRMKGDD